jgi:glycerophosphoryl diester phosphodiesterase
LILAHTLVDARQRTCVRLADALEHLSLPRFHDVGVNLDVKHVGCEAALVDALGHAGLLQRGLVSSQVADVLDRVRAIEPRVQTGISIGGRVARLSRRWQDWRAEVLAGLTSRRWDALMAQHRIIDARLIEDVVARNGHLYAWTVNDRRAIQSLRTLGVHGITTADPRLFTR